MDAKPEAQSQRTRESSTSFPTSRLPSAYSRRTNLEEAQLDPRLPCPPILSLSVYGAQFHPPLPHTSFIRHLLVQPFITLLDSGSSCQAAFPKIECFTSMSSRAHVSRAWHRLASLVVCSPVTSRYGDLGTVPRALTCRPSSAHQLSVSRVCLGLQLAIAVGGCPFLLSYGKQLIERFLTAHFTCTGSPQT